MKVLLDTQIFIWWDSEPSKLSPQVLALCQDQSNILVLSVASVWEMQIKSQLGKLDLNRPWLKSLKVSNLSTMYNFCQFTWRMFSRYNIYHRITKTLLIASFLPNHS